MVLKQQRKLIPKGMLLINHFLSICGKTGLFQSKNEHYSKVVE